MEPVKFSGNAFIPMGTTTDRAHICNHKLGICYASIIAGYSDQVIAFRELVRQLEGNLIIRNSWIAKPHLIKKWQQ